MESDWTEYKCKSGQTIFLYNKVTGEHKWPPGYNDGLSEDRIIFGQPVQVKELHSIATQTDDYGCTNGCTSIYIKTDPVLETLHEPHPGVLDDGQHDLNKEHQKVNDLDSYHSKDEHNSEIGQDDSGSQVIKEEYNPGDKAQQLNQLVQVEEIERMLGALEKVHCSSDTLNVGSNMNSVEDENSAVREDQLSIRNKVDSKETQKTMKCSFCSKVFECKSQLALHLRIHAPERSFQCSQCLKAFAKKGTLENHKRTHEATRPYECSYCLKKFKEKGNLVRHVKTHSNDKQYQCTICSKKFGRNEHLKAHLQIHARVKSFGCKHCGKKFGQKSHLAVHLRIHTGERPYECSWCKKTFADQANLYRHVKIHKGIKPHVCVLCLKQFARRDHMNAHVLTHAKKLEGEL